MAYLAICTRLTEAQLKTWKVTSYTRFLGLAGASVAALVVPVLGGHADADAQGRRPRLHAPAELPPTEGRGCYYSRGEEFCGSYCYWEINGKRYCQRRLRDAHSQAPIEHFYFAEPRPYGGGYVLK